MIKQYKPKAGDVCLWEGHLQVLIVSEYQTNGGSYIAYDEKDFNNRGCDIPWRCRLEDLTLIYRP